MLLLASLRNISLHLRSSQNDKDFKRQGKIAASAYIRGNVDGNKRIGMYVMLTFLEVNGIRLEATNEEVAETGLAVAAGTMGYQELLNWVIDHRV